MTELKYEKYISTPPRRKIAGEDGKQVFDGLWVKHTDVGYNFNMGHQFVTKPFVSNNPCHTHNFQEFLAWYGSDPDDPDDFGGEVILYMGEELEKYVFTQPTIVSVPPGLPHCPLEIARVDRPIIQIEIMLIDDNAARDPIELSKEGTAAMAALNYPVYEK